MIRSGRRDSNCAERRGDEVPTRAPSGRESRLGAPTSRSHTSARSSIAARASSGGRIVSTSFIEWTARSIRPSISAESSSLVQSALPPISEIERSRSWSPLVAIGSISISSGPQPWASRKAVATSRAWTSASGDPRVPRRRTDCMRGLC